MAAMEGTPVWWRGRARLRRQARPHPDQVIVDRAAWPGDDRGSERRCVLLVLPFVCRPCRRTSRPARGLAGRPLLPEREGDQRRRSVERFLDLLVRSGGGVLDV